LSRRVGGVYMNSQLGHDDCRRIRRCEHSRWPWPSLQFCSQCYRSRMTKGCMFVNIRICCVVKYSWIFTIFSSMTSLCRHLSAVSTGNCKLGHDCRRVCSHRRHVRHNSTVSLRRRRRCVLDITLTPTLRVGTTPWSVRCVGLPWGRRGSMRPMRYFVAPIDGYINRFQRKTGLPSVSADCVIVSHKTCVTVLSRRVGVGGVYMNSQPAHDCRRIRRCEHSRWPWPSLQFCSQCYRSRIWRNMTLHVCKHSNLLCSVIFVNFFLHFFNNDVIMSSLIVSCQPTIL